ncbi:MAG: ParB/RepB/Spo0J family partition protein [Planctomycetota bacterium]|nr:ParB/RepB/Spo0J family partition protein [Planctomycetota bacterium]MDA1162220.1 ParB/RepB/Spo0J family partition protein [Planctomycetota bacterium]
MAQDGAPKRRLGRGLDALLGGKPQQDHEPAPVVIGEAVPVPDTSSQSVTILRVDQIRRNPFQPRSEFDEQSLNELAKSIGLHGVLQPVLVRNTEKGYQLIAGERRWLAAQKAGLTEVPCRVMELADREVSEAAIEENLKRKDLNVLEKAQAFQDYVDRFGCTIEDLGKRLSMDRSTVSNMLRLLELPEPIRKLLHEEKITGGHARAMLPLEEVDQLAICGRIQAESLSVRKTEQAVRSILRGEKAATIPIDSARQQTPPAERTSHIDSLEQQLRDVLGLKVQIKLKTSESGQVIIDFGSNGDFERITRFLRKAA